MTEIDNRSACMALSSPALVRLISEIDDNGAIPPRGLPVALPDLTTHHQRQVTHRALACGIARVRPGEGLALTPSGAQLADIYDAVARWARRHAWPDACADFPTRTQHGLALLAETLDPDNAPQRAGVNTRPGPQADADLARPRDLLEQWLRANSHALQLAA